MTAMATSGPVSNLERAIDAVDNRDRLPPAEVVAAVDAAAERLETPCGDGVMVWRAWGPDGGEKAPAVVLLHGGHGAWSHWILNIPTLARRYRIFAPDMPGFGESAELGAKPGADDLAQTIVGGLDRLIGADAQASVVGFSFGGVIAGHVAKRLGDRGRALVLIGASGLGLPRAERPVMHRWRDAKTPEDLEAAHRENLAILMLADRRRVDPLAICLQTVNTRRARTPSRPISRTPALREVLADIPAPFTAVYGEHDITAKPDVEARARVLRDFQPEARFFVVPDAGHWVQYEAPDTVTRHIIEALG